MNEEPSSPSPLSIEERLERLSRRELALRAAAWGSLAWISSAHAASCAPMETSPHDRDEAPRSGDGAKDALEEALVLLVNTGPEYGGGLSNHGPMAAEALCALGREEAVVPWVTKYKRRLSEPLPRSERVDEGNWKSALGDHLRVSDWIQLFERELAEKPWRDVLDRWVGVLSPGFVAAAMHGVIRTGHAVRSLAARDTPHRKGELAQGLGYWAAQYHTLPDAHDEAQRRMRCSDVLHRMQTLRPDKSPTGGFITDRLRALEDLPSFAATADLADTSGDPSAFLSELTEAFAHVYLANGADNTITFVHGVTGPSALRLILPHVKIVTARSAAREAWRSAAALYAVQGLASAKELEVDAPRDRQALIDRAVENGDEHAIKFTEACLREHALNPKPVYLAAATDAVGRL